MSELSVGQLRGLTVNSNVITVPSGHTLRAPGHVLQVVQVAKTDTFGTVSTSFVDVTGLSATITPSSASSRILVMASVLVGYGSSQGAFLTIADGNNNNLVLPDSPGSRPPGFSGIFGNNSYWLLAQNFNLLHSPNTTSAFTYKVRMRSNFNTPVQYINRTTADEDNGGTSRGVSTITLMEIAS